MGPRTVNHAHATARVALQRAAKKRLVRTNHPARDVDQPRHSTDEREYDVMTKEGVARFFEAANGDRFEAFFVVAVLSGARPAELRALAWNDVGPDSLTFRRTASQTRSGPPVIRNTTKTGKDRVVPLMPEPVVLPGAPHSGRTTGSSSRTPGALRPGEEGRDGSFRGSLGVEGGCDRVDEGHRSLLV